MALPKILAHGNLANVGHGAREFKAAAMTATDPDATRNRARLGRGAANAIDPRERARATS